MKNYFIFSCCLAGIGLLFIQATLPYRTNNRLLENGIFDIQNSVKATSKTTFNTDNEDGISTYKTERTSPTTLKVSCTYERKKTPNPWYVNYDFEIRKLLNGNYEMDMIGAIPFMSMNIAPNLKATYTGSNLIYPTNTITGQTLPDAKGELILKNKTANKHLLTYHLEVKNRKITKTEKININGKEYEVTVHTYKYSQKTILSNDELIANIEEEVTERFIPTYGLVQQERTGKVIMPSSKSNSEACSFDSKLTSNLLTIEKW